MRQAKSVRRQILERWRQRLITRIRRAAGRFGSAWAAQPPGKRSVLGSVALMGLVLAGLVALRPPQTGPLANRAPGAVMGPAGAAKDGGTPAAQTEATAEALARTERRARVEQLLRGVGGTVQTEAPTVAGETDAAHAPGGNTAASGPTAPLHPPVVAAAGQGFGWAHSADTGDYRLHPGVDFPAPAGTTVRAVAAGVVATAEQDLLYGRTIRITHAGGWQSYYAGIDHVHVRPSDAVAPGTVLGTIGAPGPAEAARGAHLHFEIRIGDEPADPRPYLSP